MPYFIIKRKETNIVTYLKHAQSLKDVTPLGETMIMNTEQIHDEPIEIRCEDCGCTQTDQKECNCICHQPINLKGKEQ